VDVAAVADADDVNEMESTEHDAGEHE